MKKYFPITSPVLRHKRPGLAKAPAILRKKDTLEILRLDRLGRSLKHLIELVENLEEKKVGFKSLQESIDTTTSGGRLVFHICELLKYYPKDHLSQSKPEPRFRPFRL